MRRYPGEPTNSFSEPVVHEALKNPIAGLFFAPNSIPWAKIRVEDEEIPYDKLDVDAGDIPNTAIDTVAWGELGYEDATANQTGITTETDLTGLSVAVTVGTSRKVKITVQGLFTRTVADGVTQLKIKEGTTVLQTANISTANESESVVVRLTPTAGAHTYKVSLARLSGTGTVALVAASTFPAFILVEDIGPVT